MNKDKIVTLVGKSFAKKGREFIHSGEADLCSKCEYVDVCMGNLDDGRRYKITKVRDVEHECPVHGQVKVVEVVEPTIEAAIKPKKAMVGSTVTYESIDIECDEHDDLISPSGIKDGDKCKILDHESKITCNDKVFIIVKLKRL